MTDTVAAPARNLGKPPELAWLPVAKCSVDHRYQRTLEGRRSQKLIERIVATFDWKAFGAVQATPDGKGGWLIIDGQHRVEAARRLGIVHVPAVVVETLSLAEQAEAFVRANTDRVSVNTFALHRARVEGGVESAVMIDRLCAEAGIAIARNPIPANKLKPGETLALATIGRLPGRFGETIAKLTLRVLARAYAERSGGLRGPVIQAVAFTLDDEPKDAIDKVAEDIQAYLRRTDPARFAIMVLDRKRKFGGTEVGATIEQIAEAIQRKPPQLARLAVAPPSRPAAPTPVAVAAAPRTLGTPVNSNPVVLRTIRELSASGRIWLHPQDIADAAGIPYGRIGPALAELAAKGFIRRDRHLVALSANQKSAGGPGPVEQMAQTLLGGGKPGRRP